MSSDQAARRGGRAVLWVFAVLLLALAAWFIPGAIWGTSPDGLLPGWLLLACGIGFLILGLVLLWAAIRARSAR